MYISILNESNKIKRSKELLMAVTAGGKLYYMSVIPNLKIKSSNAFQNCSSPFRRDKNPSFSITHDQSKNIWYHKDFGDAALQGNIFDFAAQRHGLDPKVDFKQVLEVMYEELKIDQLNVKELQRLMKGSDGKSETFIYDLKLPLVSSSGKAFEEVENAEKKKNPVYDIELKKIELVDLDNHHKEFLLKNGISYEIMKEHNAFFIEGYTVYHGEQGYDNIDKKAKPKNEIWICYSFHKYCKLYSPLSKRFWYIGQKSANNKYLFGTPNLYGQLEGKTVILAAGEKDTLCLLSRGYHAMCLSSETALVTRSDHKWWYESGYKVITIYDLDNTGIAQSEKIKAESGIPYVSLPQWVKDKGGKDIADYFEFGGTKEVLDKLIQEVLSNNNNAEEVLIKSLPVRTAAQRIKDAKSQPDILPHADVLFQTNELTIFFGDTGKGKSIFAVALANAISKGITFLELENKCSPLRVLYYDFELSDKQFEKRYTNDNGESYVFNDNFYIDNIDLSDIDLTNKKIPFDEHLIEKIRSDLKDISANVLIIDNITFLSTFSAEDGQVAMRLMKKLKELKSEQQISIMVLAHTPKKFGLGGISLPDLAGSKHLSNFCDSVTALGSSKKDSNLRYIIQVKPSRTGEVKFDAQNVIVCEIQKIDSLLTLVLRGYAKEEEHINANSKALEDEMIEAAKDLYKQGKTYRQIADELKLSKSTIGRWLKPSEINK